MDDDFRDCYCETERVTPIRLPPLNVVRLTSERAFIEITPLIHPARGVCEVARATLEYRQAEHGC